MTKANESVRGFEGVAAAAAASRLLREKRISLSFFHVFCSFRSPDDSGFAQILILAPKSLAVSGPSWKAPGTAKRRDRRFDERRRASHRTLVTHVKTQHPGPKMSAFTMASVGTSAAVPVSPPSRAATSATFRVHRQPESHIFIQSGARRHGISRVDGIGDVAAIP